MTISRNSSYALLIAAVSEDGKIADHAGDQSSLTNPADRAHLASHLRAADLLVVGRRTFEEHQAVLQRYRCLIITRRPLDFSPTASITRHAEVWETTSGQLLWTPERLSLPEICARLSTPAVCIVGGSQLYTIARQRGWVDEMVITRAPGIYLEGGVPLFEDHPDATVWSKLASGELGFTAVETTDLPGSAPAERWQVHRYRRVAQSRKM